MFELRPEDYQGLTELAVSPNTELQHTGGNCMAVVLPMANGSLVLSQLDYTGGDIGYYAGTTWQDGEYGDELPYSQTRGTEVVRTATLTPNSAKEAVDTLHYVLAESKRKAENLADYGDGLAYDLRGEELQELADNALAWAVLHEFELVQYLETL